MFCTICRVFAYLYKFDQGISSNTSRITLLPALLMATFEALFLNFWYFSLVKVKLLFAVFKSHKDTRHFFQNILRNPLLHDRFAEPNHSAS